jgi:hypothetical protein
LTSSAARRLRPQRAPRQLRHRASEERDAVGYVIAYGPGGEGKRVWPEQASLDEGLPRRVARHRARRVKTVYGGPYRDKGPDFVELWLVPFGAEPPAPAKYENDAAGFKGKFAEYQAWDGVAWAR